MLSNATLPTTTIDMQFSLCNYERYFPMIGSSFARVAAGIASRLVRMACLHCRCARARALRGHSTHRRAQHLRRIGRVLVHHRHNLVHSHVIVSGAPAVVVGHHRHRRVADLRLPRQLRLLQVGHADHVSAPAPIQVRLGAGRKLRPFHAHVRSAALTDNALLIARIGNRLRHHAAHRIAESNMGNNSVAEERARPAEMSCR